LQFFEIFVLVSDILNVLGKKQTSNKKVWLPAFSIVMKQLLKECQEHENMIVWR